MRSSMVSASFRTVATTVTFNGAGSGPVIANHTAGPPANCHDQRSESDQAPGHPPEEKVARRFTIGHDRVNAGTSVDCPNHDVVNSRTQPVCDRAPDLPLLVRGGQSK